MGLAMVGCWMQGVLGIRERTLASGSREPEGGRSEKSNVSVFTAAGNEAYVTLLYGDEFLLGVRVLGQSIRETGTAKELVCVVTAASEEAVETLKGDGWKIYTADTILNPSRVPGYVTPARFWAVFTKLVIFKLPYRKVVYLDADTVVLKNIDELFECGGTRGYCANLKHSEHMNTGVIVATPDESLFDDMMRNIHSTHSYDGGDQGFLDSYFADFVNAPLFVPSREMVTHDDDGLAVPPSQSGLKLQRLPTCYNADVGLYIFNSERWSVPEGSLKVIHYTLGPIKPWDWWSSWLVKPASIWRSTRGRLRSIPADTWLLSQTIVLFLLPLCLMAALYIWLSCCKEPKGSPVFTCKTPVHPALASLLVAFLNELTMAIGFTSLTLAFMFPTVLLVPRQVPPMCGWILVYEWGVVCFGTVMYTWLLVCFGVGTFHQENVYTNAGNTKVKHFPEANGKKTLLWRTLPLTMASALVLVLVPFIPTFIPRFPVRLLMLGIGISIGTAVLAYSFITLSTMWFQAGLVAARRRGREVGFQEL